MSEGRPETFAACLRNIVTWLDATDPIIHEQHPEVAGGRGVQRDLEALASALDERETLDAWLMSLMAMKAGE